MSLSAIPIADLRVARPSRVLSPPRHPQFFAIALAVAGFGIAAALEVARATGAELSSLTRDVVAVTEAHLYTGMLSTLGIMFWAAASALCLFGGTALRLRTREGSRFLWAAGVLSAALGLDDAFMFHEGIAPVHLQLPEPVVFGTYAGSVALFLLVFWRRILASEYLLLAIALACLGASMLLDLIFVTSDLETFVEDACKFCGIVFWLSYLTCAANELVGEQLRPSSAAR